MTKKLTGLKKRALSAELKSLPPALFVVGAEDMLLEDNQRMEARWLSANGNSEFLLAPASPHAFDRLGTAIAKKVDAYVIEWIIRQLGQP